MTRTETRALADRVINILKGTIERGLVCGSYRRSKPECKDLDIVIEPKREAVKDLFGTITGYKPIDGFINAVNSIGTKSKGDPATGKYFQRILDGHKVEISTATKDNWGLMVSLRTGDKDFNIKIMNHIRKIGLDHVGGYLIKNGKVIPVFEEVDFYRAIGLPFIEPHLRNEYALRKK
jgi:DNA polymerase/3'-5' exonuclease PolX